MTKTRLSAEWAFGDSRVPAAVWAQLTDADTGCWLWTGALTAQGYGLTTFRTSNKPSYIHRTVFELLVGGIPEGLELDHVCRVRTCANPAHLDPVTHRENLLRSPIAPAAINAGKTHCKRNHEFDTPYVPGRKRRCQICMNEAARGRPRKSAERLAYQAQWQRTKRAKLRELRSSRAVVALVVMLTMIAGCATPEPAPASRVGSVVTAELTIMPPPAVAPLPATEAPAEFTAAELRYLQLLHDQTEFEHEYASDASMVLIGHGLCAGRDLGETVPQQIDYLDNRGYTSLASGWIVGSALQELCVSGGDR